MDARENVATAHAADGLHALGGVGLVTGARQTSAVANGDGLVNAVGLGYVLGETSSGTGIGELPKRDTAASVVVIFVLVAVPIGQGRGALPIFDLEQRDNVDRVCAGGVGGLDVRHADLVLQLNPTG